MNDTMSIISNAALNSLSTTNGMTYTSILDILECGGAMNIITVLLILLSLCLVSYIWRRRIKKMSYTTVLIFTGLVFLFGVVIYTVGALQSERMGFWDAVYTIPSAIISSLGMFVYQDDISELSDRAKHCSEFMAAYSIIHLFAAVITSLIMIKWLGMLVYYKWKLFPIRKKDSDLYVFWGINPASLALARSVRSRIDKDYIVFVNTVDDGEESSASIHRLLDIIKLKSDVDKQITDMDATVTNCYVNLDDRSLGDIKIGLEDFLRKYAKLTLLSMRVRSAKSIHLFFLSSDEEKNINAMGNLTHIVEQDNSERPTHLYCHARRSALTQVFENKDLLGDKDNLHLHIVDSAQLSIQSLKRNVDDCPVNFVDIDFENATVCSAFRSMIIGFGETGEEAFNFLYEFGAFVDAKGTKTPFRCTIIDKQATALRENLESKAPALREDGNKGVDCLNFVNAEMGGEGFWTTVEKEIKGGLCYIVFAINDDNACLNTAIEICSRAMRWRPADAKQLNVYVRCYNPQNYAQMASVAQDMQVHYDGITLKIIGGINDIFNYETIVDEKYLKEAKEYNWEYSNHRHKNIEDDWNDGIKIQRTKDHPTIGNIEDSFRRREQNISNALHKDTKMNILLRAGFPLIYWMGKDLSREKDPQTPRYLNLHNKKDVRVLHNVARLEHERWMASMKLQGWRPTPCSTDTRDVRQKLHEDIRSWDELRSEGSTRLQYQSYDCDVVDTSIRLKCAEDSPIIAARTAMSYFDMTEAFRLLLQPALDGNVEARRVLTIVADTFDMLFNVDLAFDGVKQMADRGNAFAQYLMSRYYRVKQVDINEEVHYATMSARQGDAAGMYALSQCYEEGRGVPCLKEKAATLRQCAVKQEHPAAMLMEVRLCFSSWSEHYNEARGLQLLLRCMELQIAESYTIMGEFCCEGRAGIAKDTQEAERLFLLAVSQGYPQAYCNLADNIYWSTKHDDSTSLYEQTLRKGMAHGVPQCYYRMAQRCFSQDVAQAVEWYEHAACLGCMEAYSVLGYMYKNGQGVDVNMPLAWRWFSRGAEYSDPDCLNALCGMIEPDRLTMIIRPVDETDSPYDEWFAKQDSGNMLVYKERLASTGAQGAADAAYYLYRAYSDASKASSELMEILMYGEVKDGTVAKDMDKAMGYIRRAAELNQNLEYSLMYGLLETQIAGSGASNVEQAIDHLERVIATATSYQKIWAVMASVRLAELYDEGTIVERDVLKALSYRHTAVLAGYEAQQDPVRETDPYDSSAYAQNYVAQYGTQILEQARTAMSHYDMATAFALLVAPSLDDYYEAQLLMEAIVSSDENLQRVPDEAFAPVRSSAHHCNSFAQYLMARYYSVKHPDPNLRLLYASLSAERGDDRGRYELSRLMAMNSMSEDDETVAHEFMDRLLEQRVTCALLYKARELMHDHPSNEDREQVRSLLKPCIESRVPESYSLMAMLQYMDDEDSTATCRQPSEKLFMQAISEGYPQAYADMALCCRTTVGDTAVSAFTPQGLQCLDQGIALGLPCCMNLKAQYFEICEDGSPRDIAESIRLYRMAAERAHVASIASLGDIYYEGRTASADPAEAWRWYSLGAAQGDAKCMYSLGLMCLDGNGSEGHKPQDSIRYFERALLLGTVYGAKASHVLFSIYGSRQLDAPAEFNAVVQSAELSCRGIAANDTIAMRYLRCAADMGYFPEDSLYYGILLTASDSPFLDVPQGIKYLERALNEKEMLAAVRLGDIYANGKGIEQDLEKAHSYYSIAVKRQCLLAQQRIEQIKNK